MASQNDVVIRLVDAGMGVEDAIRESAQMIRESKEQPGITLNYTVRETGTVVAIRWK